jgi:hypothetical protein
MNQFWQNEAKNLNDFRAIFSTLPENWKFTAVELIDENGGGGELTEAGARKGIAAVGG